MLQNVYNSVFPPTCVLCDAQSQTGVDLCLPCYQSLPHNHTHCASCSLPLPQLNGAVDRLLCGKCLTDPPATMAPNIPFRYEAPVDFMIQQLKFHGSVKYGRLIGELLARAVADNERPDLLVPVPQHQQRLLDRGFNHATAICRIVSKRLAIPMDTQMATKSDARPPQATLNAAAREKNMRGAFEATMRTPASHVAIIDDVMTTGATAEALSKALIRAGTQRVSIWAFARTE